MRNAYSLRTTLIDSHYYSIRYPFLHYTLFIIFEYFGGSAKQWFPFSNVIEL